MMIDFSQIDRADEIEEQERIIAEDNAIGELVPMAEMVEAHDVDGEYTDLVELAFMTAANNPLSETAVDIKEQLMAALREVA